MLFRLAAREIHSVPKRLGFRPGLQAFLAGPAGFFLAAGWLFLAAGLQAFSWRLLTQAGPGRP